MGYPSTVFAPATRTNGQTIDASHVNDLQTEVAAIESGLLNGFAHTLKPTADATYDLGISGTAWRDLFITRNATIGGTLGVTGAATFSSTLTGIGAHDLTWPGDIIWRSQHSLDINGVHLGASGTGIDMTTWPTTVSAANANVANGAAIKLVTSLRKNKHDIQPIPLDVARRVVRGLQGVTYRSRVDADQRVWAGLIADDVEQVTHDLAVYAPDGTLQSVTYDRIASYLLPVVLDLMTRVDKLEAA